MKVFHYLVSDEAQSEAPSAISCGDGYELIGPAYYPSFISQTFREKCPMAVRIVSGSSSNRAAVLYNFRRVDGDFIDEHPFCFLIISGSYAVSGSFIDHGDWVGRTTPIPKDFISQIESSSVGSFLGANPPEGKTSGSLDELQGSDTLAFDRVIYYLKQPS